MYEFVYVCVTANSTLQHRSTAKDDLPKGCADFHQ